MKTPIVLVPHDPHWEASFEATRRAWLSACGDIVIDASHTGSTAIPGIAAKPIIDILVCVRRYEDGLLCVGGMASLEFDYRGSRGIEGRHYFRKGDPHTHHTHVCAADHSLAERYLRFRDYLREHLGAALEYENLKRELAARTGSNTLAYSNAKSDFCDRIDQAAGRSALGFASSTRR